MRGIPLIQGEGISFTAGYMHMPGFLSFERGTAEVVPSSGCFRTHLPPRGKASGTVPLSDFLLRRERHLHPVSPMAKPPSLRGPRKAEALWGKEARQEKRKRAPRGAGLAGADTGKASGIVPLSDFLLRRALPAPTRG